MNGEFLRSQRIESNKYDNVIGTSVYINYTIFLNRANLRVDDYKCTDDDHDDDNDDDDDDDEQDIARSLYLWAEAPSPRKNISAPSLAVVDTPAFTIITFKKYITV